MLTTDIATDSTVRIGHRCQSERDEGIRSFPLTVKAVSKLAISVHFDAFFQGGKLAGRTNFGNIIGI